MDNAVLKIPLRSRDALFHLHSKCKKFLDLIPVYHQSSNRQRPIPVQKIILKIDAYVLSSLILLTDDKQQNNRDENITSLAKVMKVDKVIVTYVQHMKISSRITQVTRRRRHSQSKHTYLFRRPTNPDSR